MAEGVTYADLRFAKSRPPGEAHEEASDGEFTYENFPASAARPRQPPGPEPPPQAPGPLRRRLWSAAPLALLGACLFLLATGLGLGLRYWQVSRQLQGASQRHGAESSALAGRIGSQGENLTQTQAELEATRLALWQSWQAGNGTRRQLEEERMQWKLAQRHLRQQKDNASRELEEARSCQQMGCCPQDGSSSGGSACGCPGSGRLGDGARKAVKAEGPSC